MVFVLEKVLEKKIQVGQIKCIRFCLHLDKKGIRGSKFKEINCLNVNDRYC